MDMLGYDSMLNAMQKRLEMCMLHTIALSKDDTHLRNQHMAIATWRLDPGLLNCYTGGTRCHGATKV
jgi:hypothetical protein